jgi:hypothetical protein
MPTDLTLDLLAEIWPLDTGSDMVVSCTSGAVADVSDTELESA